MFVFKNKTILILSPEDWGVNLLSKHLYALELSKNNTVYFLHTSPHPQQKELISTYKIQENITLIHFKKVARGIFKLPSFLIDFQNKYLIQKLYNKIEQPIDILWSFDQSKFQNLKQFKAKISIFHPVDYIKSVNPFVNRIANSANVVLSVSDPILNTIDTKSPKFLINHGIDNSFFQHGQKVVTPIFLVEDKLNIGYIGNMLIKLLDWETLIEIVKTHTECNFIFIGPTDKSNISSNNKNKAIDTLKSFSNTVFTGQMHKEELASVLPFFDAFWLCYDNNKYPIEVSNSHKIMEYLSTGKVIISNYFEIYKNSGLLEMSQSKIEFIETFNKTINNIHELNNAELQKKRIEFAKDNIYEKQIERIEKIINGLK
ncbi:MAG: hypothetical protein IT232_10450 [Flavobacteriales bacterium]|nr:hypothetical protein [Flavobacteriales bacterium]